METKSNNCLFCNIDPGRIIAENDLAADFGIKDQV